MQTVTITLPLPPALLSGHNKGHWRSRAGVIKAMRQQAFLAAKSHAVKLESAGVWYLFLLPNKRRRDVANLVQCCKPYIDGIVDAGVVPDDSWKYLWIEHAKARPCATTEQPMVEVTFRGTAAKLCRICTQPFTS